MLPKTILLSLLCVGNALCNPSILESMKNLDKTLKKAIEDVIDKGNQEYDFNSMQKEISDQVNFPEIGDSVTGKLDNAKERLHEISDSVTNSFGGAKEKLGNKFKGLTEKLGESFADISGTVGSKARDAKTSIEGVIADLGNLRPDGPLSELPEPIEETPEDDLQARSARRNRLQAQKLYDINEYSPPWVSLTPTDMLELSPGTALWLQFALTNVTNTLLRDLDTPNWAGMFRALGPEKEILKRYATIGNRFEILEAQTTEAMAVFESLSERLPNSSFAKVWADMEADIVSVSSLYQWFAKYQNNMAIVNERTLSDYAETVHGDQGSALSSMLAALHANTCGDCVINKKATANPESANEAGESDLVKSVNMEEKSLLEGLEDQMVEAVKQTPTEHESVPEEEQFKVKCEETAFKSLDALLSTKVYQGEICTLTKSPQQLVFDLYNILALTDAKGYAMMQFSWMLLRLADKGNFSREADLARVDFQKRVTEKAEVARRVISELPTWYDRCIPSQHVENQTYIQFTELLQGYMVNEVDLNKDNTCKEECKAYPTAQEQGCYKKTFCNSEKRCDKGKLHSCTFFEADSTACISKDKSRRYDWIEYKSGRVIGQKTKCDGGKTLKADSWWRFLYHCSNCICLCDQPGPRSDRYISLKPSTANFLGGNVVTGVRFLKKGRVVYLQIQEGKALPRGAINSTSLNWRPVEPITPDESASALINKYSDYAVLSWEERAIDLDHLNAPEDHVLTGLRFRRLGGHINLEIQVAPVQFATGWIDYAGAHWLASDTTPASEKPRKIISLKNADVPTRATTRPLQDSGDNQYIEFQATSIDKDVAQTTIPFIDAQEVSPQPPVWLSGVALVHKGDSGTGGFLSLKVATYDMTKHILAPSATRIVTAEDTPQDIIDV